MATITKFEDIISWQEARELNKVVGKSIDEERFKKNFTLIGQIEGSAGSIMDNIAEGFERNGNREFINFLSYSKGSCGELKSQLYRSFDKNIISEEQFRVTSQKIELVKNKIGAFMKYLNTSEIKGLKFNNKQ